MFNGIRCVCLSKYKDFIVDNREESGKGKPITDTLKMKNFKRSLLLTYGVNFKIFKLPTLKMTPKIRIRIINC